MTHAASFLELIQNPIKFRFYLLSKLPAAFFSGIRIEYADENKSVVTVPYKWFTKNPFGSTYFACLSMAAEMSSGVLAMAHAYKRKPGMSMLVIKTEANFLKKAKGLTTFTCEDGLMIEQTINEAAASGKSLTIMARSVGTDSEAAIVAEFAITWSFKSKNN